MTQPLQQSGGRLTSSAALGFCLVPGHHLLISLIGKRHDLSFRIGIRGRQTCTADLSLREEMFSRTRIVWGLNL